MRRLRAPTVELIADRPDLSLALAYAYEAAGAPTLREIQENSDNPHALPLSTVGRIVARKTVPADEQQLLAFLHGCGVRDQDAAWRKAWAKVATACEGLGEHPQVPDSRKVSVGAGVKTGRVEVVIRPEVLAKLEELAESDARSERLAGAPNFHSRAAALRSRVDRWAFHLLVARQGGVFLGKDWRGLNGAVSVKCPAGHMGTVRPVDLLLQHDYLLCNICERSTALRRIRSAPRLAWRHVDAKTPAARQASG